MSRSTKTTKIFSCVPAILSACLKLPRRTQLPVASRPPPVWIYMSSRVLLSRFLVFHSSRIFQQEFCPPKLFPTRAGFTHIRPFPVITPCWLASLSGSGSTPCNEDCSNSYRSAGGVERGTSEICSWQELGWRSSSRINVLTPKEAELLGESWKSYREDDAHFYQTQLPNCFMRDTSAWSSQPKHFWLPPYPT